MEYNLRFFAKDGPGGEKTEQPTSKKLSDARKEGQVAKSKEISTAAAMLALFIILKIYTSFMGDRFLSMFKEAFNFIPEMTTFYHGEIPWQNSLAIFRVAGINILLILAPIFLIGVVLAFVCDVVQVKWQPTAKPLQPKFSKLNPLNGFKRIFSLNSLVELGKSLLKLGLILIVCYNYLKGKENYIMIFYEMTLMQSIALIGDLVVNLGLRISAVYIIIALLDYVYQKVKFTNDMKMTKQEVKDEYKLSEGDPQIKGKIRQRMREASRRRMMQDLPHADVVITNPTHLSVAIQYDPKIADAPRVIAKGEDYLAMKIREIARENDIEIVENKPLARMLYANVEVGEVIPPELYQAVADVLAFVYHAKGKVV